MTHAEDSGLIILMKKTVLCIAAFAMSSVIYAGCPKVAGKYELTTRIYKGTCDMKNRTDKLEAKVIQKGCNITFDFGWGVKLRGKMKNRTATIKGSYDDDGEIKKSLKINWLNLTR